MKKIIAILLAALMLISSAAFAAPVIDTSKLTTAFNFDFITFGASWTYLAENNGAELSFGDFAQAGDFMVYNITLDENSEEVAVYVNQDGNVAALAFSSVLPMSAPEEEMNEASSRLSYTGSSIIATPLMVDHFDGKVAGEEALEKMALLSSDFYSLLIEMLSDFSTDNIAELITGITKSTPMADNVFSSRIAMSLNESEELCANFDFVFAPVAYEF